MKSILFKLEIEGNGIVNYDGSGDKFRPNQEGLKHGKDKNTTYAKKNFYPGEDGNIIQKIKISANSLRHAIFNKEHHLHTSKINSDPLLLTTFIANPMSLLRGYMFTMSKDKATIKKKGALTIIDAEQTQDSIYNVSETFIKSGERDSKENTGAEKSNTIFKKETVGDITYSTKGSIDLQELQFVSVDPTFDRYSMNPDNHELFTQLLQTQLPHFSSDIKEYKLKTSAYNVPEKGFMFSDEDVTIMVRMLLERMLSIDIKRSAAYAQTSSLKIKFVDNPLEQTMNDDNGWIDIRNMEDINNINIEVEPSYTEV